MQPDILLLLIQRTVGKLAQTVLASEPQVNVFVFGSRASGLAGSRSDIDIGVDLGHVMAPQVLAALQDSFDALPILQKVDVVDFSAVDERFKAVALQHTRSLYERQAA